MQDFSSEDKIYTFWEKNGFFKADPNSSIPRFSLLIPPPNVTGDLHLGHAMQHIILDALARYKRLRGYDVLLLPGVDHAGIQFEGTLNKQLEKEGTNKNKLGREAWTKRAWEFKEQVYKTFRSTWTVFGLSADWQREVFTLEEKVQRAVLHEFQTFWDQDLLYKGAYIVQWCPKCGTAIEDVEMEYEERKEKLYFMQYGPLVIATARPETKFGDTAMAVNPHDLRYTKYIGKEFEIETLSGSKKMRVIADEYIKPDFGTGVEKVTPAHDINDYEIGKRHNLPVIPVIDKQGRLTEVAGKYAGLKTHEAREKMLPELREKGILIKEEDYTHTIPVCERCKTTIEPIISEEWFVKMAPIVKKALPSVSKIHYEPDNYAKILTTWIENVHDWSISRSLWWGHRIPVWYCQDSNPGHLVGKDKDLVISLTKPTQKCICGSLNWIQDEQVLDTWFSSGLWPMVTLGWPEKTKEFAKYFPYDFEITAPEIKYLWIARMIMLSVWFTDKIPFKTMFFHGMLRDLQGRKFSKSLGNGIDPNAIRTQWGTDATRMALYSYAAPGRDGKASRQTMDERAKNYRNFATKLRNITRFIIVLKPENKDEIGSKSKEDIEILASLEQTTERVTKHIENFQFHLATDELYNFVWHEFADSYIESIKTRRATAQPILEEVLLSVLRLLHPFMPFVTEELYQKLPEHKLSIMQESWSGK